MAKKGREVLFQQPAKAPETGPTLFNRRLMAPITPGWEQGFATILRATNRSETNITDIPSAF